MDKILDEFFKAALELGKELLDKETLTEKEENFLEKLELVMEKNM